MRATVPAGLNRKEAEVFSRLDPERLPHHVAIIMDGNGRWAQRRRLPRKAISLRRGARPRGIILLVDDVWTTGTTLLRCAQALQAGGAEEVRVLTLFRAM